MANTVHKSTLVAVLTGILCAVCSVPAAGQSGSATIAGLVEDVNLDSLTSYVEVLSGMTPVMVSDSVLLYQRNDSTLEIETVWLKDTLVTLTNRLYLSNDVATYWIEKKLRSFGFDSVVTIPGETEPWLRNVLAIKRGTVNPDRQYIICAHYDGVQRGPGADDNGSGSAAVLEAARLLAEVDVTSTLVFALWDSEEPGLFGSAEYAAAASEAAIDIRAVINLDMVGWDGDDDRSFEIHSNDQSSFIVAAVKDAISEFQLNLVSEVFSPGTGRSDHASFWKNDYPAVLLIEDFSGGDFNPRYHQSGDSLQYFNLAYFHELAKLGLATIAGFTVSPPAVSNEAEVPHGSELRLGQNLPNPFSSTTQISFTLAQSQVLEIRVWDMLGRIVDTISVGQRSTGTHTVTWVPPGHIPSGVYVYSIETPTVIQNQKMMFAR